LQDAVRDRAVNGRRVVIRWLQRIEDLAGIQALFITAAAEDDLPRIMTAVNGRSVLLVGETAGALRAGGIIGFEMRDNRVQFSINQAAAERRGLKISSQVLNLAVSVIHGEGQGR
jgi:hypothetical protein